MVELRENLLSLLNNCLTKTDTSSLPPGLWDFDAGRPRNKDQFENWLDTPAGQRRVKIIDKSRLAIPDEYNCSIDVSGGGLGSNNKIIVFDCWDSSSGAKNVYSVSRRVVVLNDNLMYISKADFEDCLEETSCKLVEGTITLKVWKA